jgi:hypothetical protein
MKIVSVSYLAKSEFVQQNSENIRAVMADLQHLAHSGIHYHCCLGQDGQTFTHTAFFQTEELQKVLSDLPSFQFFQQQLRQHGLQEPPHTELLSLIGTSSPIFK